MSEEGTHEEVSCMFDNHFTIEYIVQPGASANWVGTVSVVGFVQDYNTIRIPVDETW